MHIRNGDNVKVVCVQERESPIQRFRHAIEAGLNFNVRRDNPIFSGFSGHGVHPLWLLLA